MRHHAAEIAGAPSFLLGIFFAILSKWSSSGDRDLKTGDLHMLPSVLAAIAALAALIAAQRLAASKEAGQTLVPVRVKKRREPEQRD